MGVKLSDSVNQGFNKRGYIGGEPLHELLSCYTYCSDGDFFHTEDGRFARIWKLPIHDMSSRPEADYFTYGKALSTIVTSFPGNQAGQFIRVAHTDIRDKISQYQSDVYEDAGEFSKAIIDSVVDQQVSAATNPKGFFQQVKSEDLDLAETKVLDLVDPDRRDATAKNIETEVGEGAKPFQYDLYMILTYKGSLSKGKIFADSSQAKLAAFGFGGKSANQIARTNYNRYVDEFMEHVQEIQQTMVSVGIPVQILTGQGVVDLLYNIMNPIKKFTTGSPLFKESESIPTAIINEKHDKHDAINRQAPFSSVKRNKKGWNVTYNGHEYYYRVTSLTQRPDQTFPGVLQSALGNDSVENIITINFRTISPTAAFWRLKIKDQLLGTKERLHLGDESVREQQRTDLDTVKSIISPENITSRQSMIDASVHIVNMGLDEEEVELLCIKQERLFENRGHYETERGDAVIHSAIPFNFRKETHEFIDRSVPYLSDSLANMIPMYGSYQGVIEPKILVNNRDGSPVFIDLWNSNVITGHSLIAGTTGSGKSFTFNNFLMACIAKYRPKVWIIDKGRSYETLCNVVDGNYIELVTEETVDERNGRVIVPTCINPLHTPLDDNGHRIMPKKEELEFQTKLFAAMILSSSKMGATDTEMKSSWINLIYDSLVSFYKKTVIETKTAKEATFSDYIAHLIMMDKESVSGKEVAESLSMYYGDGPYAAIFDGELDVDWDNDFIVLETEYMATSPCLGVVLLALFRQIDLYSKFKLPKNRPKIIAVDEAWSTLKDKNAANALGAFYRELRKYKGACLLISQGLTDFIKLVQSEGSGAEDGILANTSHYFLLACGDADYAAALEMGFTESEVSEWRTLASIPPYFGEVFYRMKTKRNTFYSGIFRMWPTSLQRWVATTDADDVHHRDEAIKASKESGVGKSVSSLQVIMNLAKKLPFGVNYAKAS